MWKTMSGFRDLRQVPFGYSLILKHVKPEKLTPRSALEKLTVYCRYQERCHSEVREKLASYGVFGKDADEITARLIEEDFLNEERFAIQFAGGRFRIKKWGREKIAYALRKKGISPWCVQRALKEIGGDDYEQTFEKMARQQLSRVSGVSGWMRKKQKVFAALRSRGFEPERISRYLAEAEKQEKKGKKKS